MDEACVDETDVDGNGATMVTIDVAVEADVIWKPYYKYKPVKHQ